MLLLLFFLELTFFFLSNVTALSITIQPDTIVGLPSLVLWTRDPSDGNGLLGFDLRFVKPNDDDVGLALANIQAQPSTQFGTAQVVFPSPGSYQLVAVSGPGNTKIGQSGQVNAFQVPTSSLVIPTSTSQPTPSATSSATLRPTPSVASRTTNVGAIVGGTLGGVAFLGLLAALGIFFLRRRHRQPTENKKRRWTFHRDKMILPPVLDIRRISPMNSEFSSPEDIEHQGGLPHDDNNILPTSPIVITASSPRSILRSPHRPLPPPPPPPVPVIIKSHQEDMVDQMEQIRNKMAELEKNPGPTQHIILDDLQKHLNWLESQMKKENPRS